MNKPLSRAVIQEQQLVARYVAGKMSTAEAEAFEDYCVAHPDVTAEVELEKRMKAGLAKVIGESHGRPYDRAFRRPWVWAAAACLVVAVAGMLLVRQYSDRSAAGILAALSAGSSPAPGRVRLAELRGTALPSLGADSSVLMEIELVGQFEIGASYQASLGDTDAAGNARILAQLQGLRPASATSLKLLLDGARIPAGVYSLVAAPDPPGRTLEFTFRKD